MNNFFTQSLNIVSKNSDVLDSEVKKLDSNTSGNFFTQNSLQNSNIINQDIISDPIEITESFFINKSNVEHISEKPEEVFSEKSEYSDSFFTQTSLTNFEKPDHVVSEKSESSDTFFITNSLINSNSNDIDVFDATKTLDIENFFGNSRNEYNFLREYSKGKSFKFSNWNSYDTYNNDEFVQDFVKYDKKLWACISKTPVINIPPYESTDPNAPWELILEGVSDVEFRQVGNQIQWKYEDKSEWYLLFELVSVSKQEILEMLDNINIEYNSDDEFNEFKQYTIKELNKKVDKELGKGLSANDFTNELKSKLDNLSNYNDSEIKNLISSEATRAQLAESELNSVLLILTGSGDGSINKTISDTIKQLVGSAPESLNTLQKIADVINQNKNSINALSQSVETTINTLERDVDIRLTNLEKIVSGGEIESGGDNTTLLGLITSNTSKINQLDSKVQVIDNSTEWLEFE